MSRCVQVCSTASTPTVPPTQRGSRANTMIASAAAFTWPRIVRRFDRAIEDAVEETGKAKPDKAEVGESELQCTLCPVVVLPVRAIGLPFSVRQRAAEIQRSGSRRPAKNEVPVRYHGIRGSRLGTRRAHRVRALYGGSFRAVARLDRGAGNLRGRQVQYGDGHLHGRRRSTDLIAR